MIKLLVFYSILISGCTNQNNTQQNISMYNGRFEGTEPFWLLEIENNNYTLHCNNEISTGKLYFSNKSSREESIAFNNSTIFGIINRSENSICDYAILEKDSVNFDIIFSYNNQTYRGCGDIFTTVISIEEFAD